MVSLIPFGRRFYGCVLRLHWNDGVVLPSLVEISWHLGHLTCPYPSALLHDLLRKELNIGLMS